MNGALTFVFLVVLVVMIAGVARSWIEQRSKGASPDQELADTLAKIEQLEERIRVLERIVTENRFDLKREIDSL